MDDLVDQTLAQHFPAAALDLYRGVSAGTRALAGAMILPLGPPDRATARRISDGFARLPATAAIPEESYHLELAPSDALTAVYSDLLTRAVSPPGSPGILTGLVVGLGLVELEITDPRGQPLWLIFGDPAARDDLVDIPAEFLDQLAAALAAGKAETKH